MAEKHNRLGKGLNSIFGTGALREESRETWDEAATGKKAETGREHSASQPEERSAEGKPMLVRINLIQPNLHQPRKDFAEEALEELAASVRTYGIIQPILVKKQGALYEIIAGERRWRAAKLAGLREVPVILADMDERKSREVAIIENIQRADLNAVEEALAYQSLLSEYGMTQEELSERVAKKRSTITNSLRILKLEPELLELVRNGSLSQGHARALLAFSEGEKRRRAAERCIAEGLSVRELERLVKSEEKPQQERERKPENDELGRLRVIYKELEKKMKQRLGTKVSIVPKNEKRGKLEIEYYSQEELDRLLLFLNRPFGEDVSGEQENRGER